ncbi:Clp protease ClpP [Lactobacillus mellis]|nr:Clp protease ClpP [Bombilactobacillus mellis]
MTKTINIKGDVVNDETAAFYSFFDIPSISPSQVSNILNDDNDDVTVDIASDGGDVFAASEIYTLLKKYSGKVTVNIEGLAASAASVIAMAGDQINISPTAQIMIHKAWGTIDGNSDDFAHQATVLSGIDESIAAAYEAKTGMKQTDLLHLMSQETWLTAQEAVDKGFADEIMFVDQKAPQVVNSISHIPSKKAVNKLFNLISQVNYQENQSQPSDDLKNRKLAILLGKKE